MRILFVCHANLCRSVLAQALLQKYLPQAEVFSCGLYTNPQERCPDKVKTYLARHSIDLPSPRPVQLMEQDLQKADWIFCMEPQQVEQLTDLYAPYTDKIWLLNEFVYGKETPVPDPSALGQKAFFKQADQLNQTIVLCAKRLQEKVVAVRL